MNSVDLALVRPVLQRLLEQDALPGLSDPERRALERIAGTTAAPEALVRPLWYWIRDGFWCAPASLQTAFLESVDRHLADLLKTCGAPVPTAITRVRLLLTPITRDELLAGVTQAIRAYTEDEWKGRIAAAIAGFAGFAALAPAIERGARMVNRRIGSRMAALEDGTLLRFGCPAILDFPLDSDEAQELRLLYVHGLGTGATLELYQRALGQHGWMVSSLYATPNLFEHFAERGGDVVAAIEGFNRYQLHNARSSPAVVHAAAALARALRLGGDDVVVRGLRALARHASSAEYLRALVYAELATAGVSAALPVLEEHLAKTLDGSDTDIEDVEHVCLLWAIGMLRADGPAWLAAAIRSADAEPDDVMLQAGELLSISRADASDLALPVPEDRDASSLPWLVHLLRQGRLEMLVRALLSAKPEAHELAVILQLLACALQCSGRDESMLRAAVDLLWAPTEGSITASPAAPDAAALLPFLSQADIGSRFALLRRAQQLPPGPAAALCASVVVRSGLFTDHTSEEVVPFDLGLVELGCIEDVAQYVGDGVAALVRVHTGQYSADGGVPAPDRALALAVLLVSPDLPDGPILNILRSDPAAGPLIALRLFGERGESHHWRRVLMGTDPVTDMIGALASTDPLSRAIKAPLSTPTDPHLSAVVLLMASPYAPVRAIATSALFSGTPPTPELLALRKVQLLDVAPAVRRSLVEHLPHMQLTDDELTTVADLFVISDDEDDRAALATYIGESGTDAHGMTLMTLAGDQHPTVVKAAHKALAQVLARGACAVVCLSIADPWDLYQQYDLSVTRDVHGYMTDQRAEGLRFLLAAMEKRADAITVRAEVGRRVVVEPLRSWPPPPSSNRLLDQAAFEALALHLQVVFVDAETGSIVAEVGQEPSGEIIHAIFETGDTALLLVEWE